MEIALFGGEHLGLNKVTREVVLSGLSDVPLSLVSEELMQCIINGALRLFINDKSANVEAIVPLA